MKEQKSMKLKTKTKKIDESKSWSFRKKNNKTKKPLLELTRFFKKREKAQITNFMNELGS